VTYRAIEARTGIGYSTVGAILRSRVYLGEILHNGKWHTGHHEPIVTEEEWHAANRGFVRGRRRGKDLLSGRVRCGLCGRRMPVAQNGTGRVMYRCRHRGQGCKQPARTNTGLVKAAVLGLGLVGRDQRLQEAIRRQLSGGGRGKPGRASRRRRTAPADALKTLSDQRRKLLGLYYEDKVPLDLFHEEEQRLTAAIEAARVQSSAEKADEQCRSELEARFEEVAAVLQELDIERVWEVAEDGDRRVLIEELLEWVTIYPDHMEVTVAGAPPLNVLYSEVGL